MTQTETDQPPVLDRLRAALMAYPAAQMQLAAHLEAGAFQEATIAWANARGIPLTMADIRHFGRDAIGMHLFEHVPQRGSRWPSGDWLPSRLVVEEVAVDWLHFAGMPLIESFYADSVRGAQVRPFNRLMRYRTPLLDFIESVEEDVTPDGFVFHMSRCGSTLAAQMLAAAPGNIVVSEAAPLDTIVQLPLLLSGIDPALHLRMLRAMVSALCRNRDGTARRRFLKLDSWHMLALPLFRAAYPETPWIYLYRDPVEVLVSHARMPGHQTAPGMLPPGLFGLASGDERLPEAEYTARVLARTSEAAIEGLGRGGMLVEYRELPDAMFSRILPHFGVTADPAGRAAMAAAGERDAKEPNNRFRSDRETKQREASPAIRAAADKYLAPVHARLEELRG